MSIYEILGLLGVAFYLGGYALLQLGLIKGSSYQYALMNLAGAVLSLVSLTQSWNMASAITQFAFATLSLIGMIRVWLLTRGLEFSAEEQTLLASHFPSMSRVNARALLRAGEWVDLPKGEELTEQGVPVTHLTYLAAGAVEIEVNGKIIAHVGPGGFIGEMGCMEQTAASATVRTDAPTRAYIVSGDKLQKLAKRNADINGALEVAFAGNTRAKLVATNKLLQVHLTA